MDEKLKQEIAQLSDLIGSRRLGLNRNIEMPSAQVGNVSRVHLGNGHTTKPLSSLLSRADTITRTVIHNRSTPYPNPFRYISTGYVRQVFPDVRDRKASISIKTGEVRYSYSSCVVNQGNGLRASKSSSIFDNSTVVSNNAYSISNGIGQPNSKSNKTLIRSLDLNAQAVVNVGEFVSSKSVIVNGKAHVNPAHSTYQLIKDQLKNKRAGSNCTGSLDTTALNDNVNVDNDRSRSRENSSSSKLKPSTSPPMPGTSSTTVRTQYKLDRREKRPPTRKRMHQAKVTPRLTKSFKQYSMRLVPTSSSGQTISQFHNAVIKNSVAHTSRDSSSKKARTSVIVAKSPNFKSSKGKSKIIVDCDGNKFIRKNGGKVLKRVKSKNSIVNISGNDFVRKNGGKSLKRLKSPGILKKTPKNSQSPHLGLRLAQRAVVKSKLALSQRTWKKKQLCVFYNRFGECKRNESNTCPYLHDRKHVLICPKFIVCKCTSTECKLSHDLKIGRMPPCQFYNKSECSRQNCPYPHVKSSPLRKKSAKPVQKSPSKGGENTNLSSKRSILPRKLSSPKIKQDIQVAKETTDKSRYYEQIPINTPEVSIVPRRLPRGVLSTPIKPTDNDSDSVCSSVSATSTSSVGFSENENLQGTGSSVLNSSDPKSSRRSRLLNKVSRLVERVKVKQKQQISLAPEYLPLKK